MELRRKYTKDTILCIPDMHIPYHHPDSLAFLKAVKKTYAPTLVINLGDLGDFHGISFHRSHPNLYSPGHELEALREGAAALEKVFPDMYIVGSNHGDLPIRKFIDAGLPLEMLNTFNEIYKVGSGWKFVNDLTLIQEGQPDFYICHNIKKNALAVAQQRGQRFMQGHYHENFELRYCGNPNSLLWAVTGGCLIDKESLAFEYNKLNLNRPILGCVVVENGMPTLLPMLLDKGGKWVKELV